MKKQSGFTILELLVALSISAFVILGMLQGYRNVSNIIDRTRNIMVMDRKVCLLFNQFERDLTTAFIPFLSERVEPKTGEKSKTDVNKFNQEKNQTEKKEEDKFYFVGEIFPDNDEKIQGKRRELFKSLNFITTNALRIYSQKRVMLVRVMYELVKDKEKSHGEKNVYQLLRRETTELDNFEFKENDSVLQKDKASDIKTVVVADNIKNLFVEYIADKTREEKKRNIFDKEEIQKTRSFVWGDKKDTTDIVPEQIEVFITFWNDNLQRESFFECLIPILSYPTEQPIEDKKQSRSQVIQNEQGAKPNEPVGQKISTTVVPTQKTGIRK